MRYTTDNELVVSGNTPIMKALVETYETRRNVGKIKEIIDSSQAWGGMRIGQGEDDVKTEAPDAKAAGAEAETETEPSEEHVNLERKRREELRHRETQMGAMDTMSKVKAKDPARIKKIAIPEHTKMKSEEVLFLKIKKTRATKKTALKEKGAEKRGKTCR